MERRDSKEISGLNWTRADYKHILVDQQRTSTLQIFELILYFPENVPHTQGVERRVITSLFANKCLILAVRQLRPMHTKVGFSLHPVKSGRDKQTKSSLESPPRFCRLHIFRLLSEKET
ncbi:unnamed protein product [Dicrocoelium dendriticum]|nr:unnamed protein product [Dicrocoelium dendriticum]